MKLLPMPNNLLGLYMSLSTEELLEGFIALLILVVAFMMVKDTIAITVQYEHQLLPTFL